MKCLMPCLFGLLATCSVCLGTPIDQSQMQFEKVNDWASGTAQSFTAGNAGLLKGIRLPMIRVNGPRDLTINLKHVDVNGIPTGPLLASGTLPAVTFIDGKTNWYTIEFDVPYEQEQGEKLSFTLQIGPAGTPYGYLRFGHSTNNPYSGGLTYYQGFYGPASWTYDKGHVDLAFQTLGVLKPELAIAITNNNLVCVSIPMSYTDCVYHLEYREDFFSGVWSTYTSKTGTQSGIQWEIPIGQGTNPVFFRVTAEEPNN